MHRRQQDYQRRSDGAQKPQPLGATLEHQIICILPLAQGQSRDKKQKQRHKIISHEPKPFPAARQR